MVGGGHMGNSSLLYYSAKAAIREYHRTAQTAERYFLTVLEAGSPRSRGQWVWFLLRPLSLTCRYLLAVSSHAAFLCALLVSLPLVRAPVLLD